MHTPDGEWEPEVATPSSQPGKPGVGPAAKDVTDHLKKVVSLTLELAKLEASRKAVGIGMLAGAAVFALYALGFLLAALASGLDSWLPHWLADLAVALGLLLLVVAPLALLGKKRLGGGTPKRAVHEAKLTSTAVKGDGSA